MMLATNVPWLSSSFAVGSFAVPLALPLTPPYVEPTRLNHDASFAAPEALPFVPPYAVSIVNVVEDGVETTVWWPFTLRCCGR